MEEKIPNKVTQSSTEDSAELTCCEASLAVDKDLSSRSWTGIATSVEEIWLKLEFGETFFVDRIFIYYRFLIVDNVSYGL